jgi:hypothetical protein
VNDFDGLAFDKVVSVSADDGILCIPLFEVDINIIIEHCVFLVERRGGCG